MRWFVIVGVTALLAAGSQAPLGLSDEPRRLPDGTLQSEAILKDEHQKSLKDARELRKLINEFCDAFEKSDRHVVSVQTIRKLEEIEKRAKNIRSRLVR